MTAHTLREVEGFVEVRPLGRASDQRFFRCDRSFRAGRDYVGEEPFAGRGQPRPFPLSAARPSSNEFHQFTESVNGGGRVFAMVGEAGMGKSRLLREFIQHHLPSHWRVLEAFSASYGKATPFFPIIELLRNYFPSLKATK